MQTIKSRFGRDSITVAPRCPTAAIRHRFGHVHVAESDESVEELIRTTIAERRAKGDTEWTAEMEQDAVRFALWQHAENRAEYAWVMGSH